MAEFRALALLPGSLPPGVLTSVLPGAAKSELPEAATSVILGTATSVLPESLQSTEKILCTL